MKNIGAWLAMVAGAGVLPAGGVPALAVAQAVKGTPPVVGSRVVASAEPGVARPRSTPCSVTLLQRETFDDHGDGSSMAAHPHRFGYAAPRGCAGAWGKVVLEADFSVPAGRQFDRTVGIWLGGVNLYFGTTMEPEPDLAQHWHVERDLTELSALFRTARAGQIVLNNWISETTNQPIYVTARLLFYPREAGRAAPAVADQVYPLSRDAAGEEQAVQTADEIVARQFTFPLNVERAYVDVIAQSQAHDERWYTCVDKRYLEQTRDYSLEAFEACDGGSFRGVEVLVDGRPAGLAPVYPWIFAGGIAPHLWLPTPGIQTINFLPFRVDLTPFAGVLDDGKPHTVGVRVLGADHFFNVAAHLLVYRDRDSAQLRGELLQDTLSDAQPAGLTVHDTLHADGAGRVVGTIRTEMAQSYVTRGVLHTARGDLATTVHYDESFSNDQAFARPGAKLYDETIRQDTTVAMKVTRDLNGRLESSFAFRQQDPLFMAARKTMVTTGQDFTARVAVRQGHTMTLQRRSGAGGVYDARLAEDLDTRDRADGKMIPPPLDRSDFHHEELGRETVQFKDSLGSCYQAEIASREERLTAVREGAGCAGQKNHLDSRSLPDDPWLMPLVP